MEFSSKVRKLLGARRMSQAELAESLGTTQQQVSRWLESKAPPKASYLLRLARTLGVTADYLIDDAQDEPATPGAGLTADEERVLWLVREMGLTAGEVLRKLAGEPGGKAGEGVGVLPTVKSVDRTGDLRRDEARRSGPEPESDRERLMNGDDIPAVRGK